MTPRTVRHLSRRRTSTAVALGARSRPLLAQNWRTWPGLASRVGLGASSGRFLLVTAGAGRCTGPVTTRMVLVADTHLPTRARELPAEVWGAVEDADVVVHAGDWVAESLLDEFESRSRRLLAVWEATTTTVGCANG